MKLPDEHGGAKVNGSVRLELRGVAIGVSAATWQLSCEGVCAREHAHAPFGQGEQGGSTPRVHAFALVQTSAAWPRGDTKPTARARRRHRDKM
jgi:hypothetical protein